MKKSWEEKKLGEACEIEYGTRVVRKRDGGTIYPVYGGGGATFFMDNYNREDCLIVARFAMSEQCTRFVKGKFFLNDSGLTVKPREKIGLLQDFLDLQILFLNDQIYSLARGTAQKNLDVTAFRSIVISYPNSFTEQKRIVKILNELFEKIAKAKENAEKNLQNARELFKSYLQSVFGNSGNDWKEKKLEEVAEVFSGFAFKSGQFTKVGKYQVIRMGNVRPGLLRIDENPVFIDKIDGKSLSRSLLQRDDIIITQTGTKKKRDYGYTVAIDKDNYLLNQRLAVIRFPEKFNHRFFLYFSWSDKFRDQFFANETGTVGQGNVGIGAVTGALMPVPKIEKQNRIVAKLDAISLEIKKLETIYQQKLACLKEVRKSILQKAFNGELAGIQS
ncbi:MAG: restriction endonuclease subunit S [Omnitrophica bacterium]|nr:restriction endonuclease subunit S [Candidatus Omnitrophota bacterium]